MISTEKTAGKRNRNRNRGPMLGLGVLLLAAALLAVFLLLPPEAETGGNSGSTLRWPRDSAQAAEENGFLLLVNQWNPLPERFEVTVQELDGGQSVDQRCYPDLQAMMDDCREAGCDPLICSSYRSWEFQQELYDNKVEELLAQGMTQTEAVREAGTIVAVPGTSEHQLGLALDIVDMENQNLDETQEETSVQKWLMENSWRYGFVLRYPVDKSEITGIIYEPWHYRYVGKTAAREIYEAGLCLEEYLEQK